MSTCDVCQRSRTALNQQQHASMSSTSIAIAASSFVIFKKMTTSTGMAYKQRKPQIDDQKLHDSRPYYQPNNNFDCHHCTCQYQVTLTRVFSSQPSSLELLHLPPLLGPLYVIRRHQDSTSIHSILILASHVPMQRATIPPTVPVFIPVSVPGTTPLTPTPLSLRPLGVSLERHGVSFRPSASCPAPVTMLVPGIAPVPRPIPGSVPVPVS